MTMTRPGNPVVPRPAHLPDRWPSAWPSLWVQTVVSALFPVLTTVFTFAALLWLRLPASSWWVAALPLLLVPISLTIPARVRRAVQRADDRGELQVRQVSHGLLVNARRRGLRRNIVVDIYADDLVVYRLHRD